MPRLPPSPGVRAVIRKKRGREHTELVGAVRGAAPVPCDGSVWCRSETSRTSIPGCPGTHLVLYPDLVGETRAS